MAYSATSGDLPDRDPMSTDADQADDLSEYEAEALAEGADLGEPTSDVEAPEADVVEQHTAIGEETAPVSPPAPGTDVDADEADVYEQEQVVHLDEDDYR